MNYNLFHHNSTTAAGGAAIYIAKNLKSIPRHDLQLDLQLFESCRVEVGLCNRKLHGCMYRHIASIKAFVSPL